MKDDEEAVYPTKMCRACVGTGIDHSATPREVQMFRMLAWWVERDGREGVVRLAVFRYHQEATQGAGLGPLAYVISRLEAYVAAGWRIVDGPTSEPPSHNLKCRHCHGWGDVATSAAAPSTAVPRSTG